MDLCLFLTAEFHGIWESLVYEGEVKTQVKIKCNAVKKLEEMVMSIFYPAYRYCFHFLSAAGLCHNNNLLL